jgi:hypothetical protein
VVSALVLGTCACSADPPGPPQKTTYMKIDDMEGTTGRIEWASPAAAPQAQPGRWISYADTQCDDLVPTPEWADGAWSHAALLIPHETLPGFTSETAARLHTTAPLVNTWGAGMGFMFSEPAADATTMLVTRPCTLGMQRDLEYPAEPVDLSAYTGLAFWARAAQDMESTTVLVQFQDVNTDPRGAVCDPTPNSTNACYNGFGVVLTLTDSFERYVVDFSDLAQNPLWGYRPQPSVIDLELVYGLVFQVDTPGGTCVPPIVCPGELPQLTFDIWIDDLYFVDR